MTRPSPPRRATDAARWRRHDAAWRDPAQILSHWADAGNVDPALLEARTRGPWWDLLAEAQVTLLVTREYEHLVMGLSAVDGRPHVSFLPMPHPSGLAIDQRAGVVHLASTRNPNQLFRLRPIERCGSRGDRRAASVVDRPLVPVASRTLPGSLYLHDLALVGGVLHGNAVGCNAIVALGGRRAGQLVWWPKAIDGPRGAHTDRNYLQLNSIAAGRDLAHSCFTASTERIGRLRPGHRDFAVNRRGVVFSGRTRAPIVGGLTRPHSARYRGRTLWLDNSGYGQVGSVIDGRYLPAAALPGWTRGLCFAGKMAFVGTSRVIARYRRYAPGLDVARSECGVHAVDTRTGAVVASLVWPAGNQIFAIEAVPAAWTAGFPFVAGRRGAGARREDLFYAFEPPMGDE